MVIDKNAKRKGTSLALIAGVCWGMQGLLSSFVRAFGVSVEQLLYGRQLFAVCILTVFFLITDRTVFRLPLRAIPWVVAIGAVCVFPMGMAFYTATSYIGAGLSTALYYGSMVVTVLCSALFFKDPFGKKKAFLFLLTIIGAVLASGVIGGSALFHPVGVGLALFVGFIYGLYGILSRLTLAYCSASTITYYSFIVALLIAALFVDIPTTTLSFCSPALFLRLFLFSLISCTLSYFCFTKSIQYIDNGTAAVLSTVDLAVATALGALFLQESLGGIQLLGIAFIFSSNILLNVPRHK